MSKDLPSVEVMSEQAYLVARGVRLLAIVGTVENVLETMIDVRQIDLPPKNWSRYHLVRANNAIIYPLWTNRWAVNPANRTYPTEFRRKIGRH